MHSCISSFRPQSLGWHVLSTPLAVLRPGNRWEMVFYPFALNFHLCSFPEMSILTLQAPCARVCVYVKIHVCIRVHAQALEVPENCHTTGLKCKSLRIRSDIFTLLFSWTDDAISAPLAVWSRRRKPGYVVLHLPHPAPPVLPQRIHTDFQHFLMRASHVIWHEDTDSCDARVKAVTQIVHVVMEITPPHFCCQIL